MATNPYTPLREASYYTPAMTANGQTAAYSQAEGDYRDALGRTNLGGGAVAGLNYQPTTPEQWDTEIAKANATTPTYASQRPAAVDTLHGSNGKPPPTPAPASGIISGAQNLGTPPSSAPGSPGTAGTSLNPATPIIGSQSPGSSSSNSSRTTSIGGGSAQLGTPGQWNVTAPQTVEGRISSILDPNNPIIAQARGQAQLDAASRGLSNTSVAQTAGDAAAYQAAIPIAAADAATAAKAAGYNADMGNQFAVKNQEASNQLHLTQTQIAGQKDVTGMNIAGQKDLAGISRDTQLQIGKMNIEAQAIANKVQSDNQKLISTNGNAAQSFNQAVAAINQINLSTTMDAAHKTQAVAEVWHTTQSGLKVLGAVAGLDLHTQLGLANSPGFDANAQWVGFGSDPGVTTPGATPAATPATSPDTSGNK